MGCNGGIWRYSVTGCRNRLRTYKHWNKNLDVYTSTTLKINVYDSLIKITSQHIVTVFERSRLKKFILYLYYIIFIFIRLYLIFLHVIKSIKTIYYDLVKVSVWNVTICTLSLAVLQCFRIIFVRDSVGKQKDSLSNFYFVNV